MDNNLHDVVAAVRPLLTMMARTGADSTRMRIAKEVFRWSSVATVASVVVVAVK